MRNVMIAATLISLSCFAPLVAADTAEALVKQAQAAESNKDYATAESLYRQAAEQGNPEAERELGIYLRSDAAVDKFAGSPDASSKLSEAVAWLTKAANQGDVKAEVELAGVYRDATMGLDDMTKSYQWSLVAAQSGDVESEYDVGEDLEDGKGVASDMDAAIGWYKRSAAQGNRSAKDALLRLTPPGDDAVKQALHDGLVADKKLDADAAIQAYRRASQLGSQEGTDRLSKAIFDDLSMKISGALVMGESWTPPAGECKEMMQTLQRSADRQDAEAMYDLGTSYLAPYCVAKDETLGKKWISRSAALGNKEAQDLLKSWASHKPQ